MWSTSGTRASVSIDIFFVQFKQCWIEIVVTKVSLLIFYLKLRIWLIIILSTFTTFVVHKLKGFGFRSRLYSLFYTLVNHYDLFFLGQCDSIVRMSCSLLILGSFQCHFCRVINYFHKFKWNFNIKWTQVRDKIFWICLQVTLQQC